MRFPDYHYENVRRVVYGGDLGITFIPVCEKCGRFVKADGTVRTKGWNDEWVKEPNATCSKCGRVEMIFEGYI